PPRPCTGEEDREPQRSAYSRLSSSCRRPLLRAGAGAGSGASRGLGGGSVSSSIGPPVAGSSPMPICLELVIDHAIVWSISDGPPRPSSISAAHSRLIQCARTYSLVIGFGILAIGGVISLVCPPLPRATSWPGPSGMLQA